MQSTLIKDKHILNAKRQDQAEGEYDSVKQYFHFPLPPIL
ncbi:Uncharacterised protein [Mycobacteroides abscessus subsp. abscessus]|nr:Uncharacterised protein [Mycobacteroides abscessus subsp. abscessus]